MKSILINGLLLGNHYAGVQYSIEYYIEALSKLNITNLRFTVLVSEEYSGGLGESSNLKLQKVAFNTSHRLKRIFFENYHLPKYFLKGGFNLYHSPAYTLPYFSNIPSVVTVHDLIALDFPSLCKNETAIYFNIFLPRAIHKSKKIIAVSYTVKNDILRRFPSIDPKKIEVIYHGIHPRFKKTKAVDELLAIKLKYRLPDKYLLFIGNLEPKKNLKIIIQAFIELKNQYNLEHKLIIAGQKGWKFSSIFEAAEKSIWHHEICFLGYVDEDELPGLYILAEVLLFPSLYEGFGLPVIEAMACGCPVIVSHCGALPEISGNHCPKINPDDIGQLVSYIVKIIKDEEYRLDLILKGYTWSKSFTWQSAAEKAVALYSRV